MVTSYIGTVIKNALAKQERTQAWLAEHMGVSDAAVSKWMRTGKIARENIPRLAQALNIKTDDLFQDKGLGVSEPSAHYKVENATPLPSSNEADLCPLISWVQAGAWNPAIDNFAPGDAEEWLPCPLRHGPQTYVLRIRGESMLNPSGQQSFKDGDLIFVDPSREAVHGSLVVVRLEDSADAVFKKLVIEGDQKYLRALNPAWPEPMMKINGNAALCGVVIGKLERF